MPRSIFALVATVIAPLVLLGTITSCSQVRSASGETGSTDGYGPPQPVVEPTRVCPDGRHIPAMEPCAAPPMANGGGHEPPPPPPPPPERPRDGCLSCEGRDRDDYAGGDDASYEMGEPAEGPGFAAAVRNRLFRGLATFVKPGDMEVENWHPLEFYVGPSKAAIIDETEGRELTPMRGIWLAPVMRVTLLPDPDFKVMRQSNEVQHLGFDRTANWKWQVRPMTDGRHRLQAHVEVLELGPDGKPVREPDGSLKVKDGFDRYVDIEVEVGTWRGFLNAINNAANLGGALGTLWRAWDKSLVALIALIGTIGALVLAVRKLIGTLRGTGGQRRARRRRRG